MPESPKRHDPPSRPVDGAPGEQGRLRNLDPSRVYCLANPNCFWTGVSALLEQGWSKENHRKDGPRFFGGETANDGDVLTVDGQVLMSRPRAMHEEALKAGWQVADTRARAIGQQGGLDALRGPTGRLAQFAEDPREYRVRG